jgi:hypothetical protein
MRYISERSTDPALLVLAGLAEGPKQGYAITQDVEEVAGVKLGPGTLYGALSRLEGRDLIEALPSEDRRRPYKIAAAARPRWRSSCRCSSALRTDPSGVPGVAVSPALQLIAMVALAIPATLSVARSYAR